MRICGNGLESLLGAVVWKPLWLEAPAPAPPWASPAANLGPGAETHSSTWPNEADRADFCQVTPLKFQFTPETLVTQVPDAGLIRAEELQIPFIHEPRMGSSNKKKKEKKKDFQVRLPS